MDRIESYFNSIQLIRNVYRDDQVIGPNIFEPGLTDFLKRAVLQSSAVKVTTSLLSLSFFFLLLYFLIPRRKR